MTLVTRQAMAVAGRLNLRSLGVPRPAIVAPILSRSYQSPSVGQSVGQPTHGFRKTACDSSYEGALVATQNGEHRYFGEIRKGDTTQTWYSQAGLEHKDAKWLKSFDCKSYQYLDAEEGDIIDAANLIRTEYQWDGGLYTSAYLPTIDAFGKVRLLPAKSLGDCGEKYYRLSHCCAPYAGKEVISKRFDLLYSKSK